MSREKLQAVAEKKYKAAGGRNVDAIPWETIWQFLQTIFAGVCPAMSVKKLCKDHPIFATGELTRELMDSEGIDRKEAKLIARASVDTFGAAKAADVEAI